MTEKDPYLVVLKEIAESLSSIAHNLYVIVKRDVEWDEKYEAQRPRPPESAQDYVV